MKKYLLLGLLALVLGGGAFAWFYFKGSSKHLQLIPKNAVGVLAFDLKSMAGKADFNKIKELNWFKKMQEEAAKKEDDRKFKDVIGNPFGTGVNIMSDVYAFGVSENGKVKGGVIFDVKDENVLAETIKKMDETVKIVEENGYKAVYDKTVTVAWNKTGGIVAFVQPDAPKYEEEDYSDLADTTWMADENALTESVPVDTATAAAPAATPAPAAEKEEDYTQLKEFLKATFARTKEQSILADEHFVKFNKGRKDIGFYLSGNEMFNAMTVLAENPMAAMTLGSLNSNIKDKYFWGNLEFLNDKIQLTSHVESAAGSASATDMLKSSGLSDDHLHNITAKDAYMFLSVNLDAAKMFAYYDKIEDYKSIKENYAKMLGMSTKDLESLFGGELSVALTGFTAPPPAPPVDPNDPYAALYQQGPTYPMPQFTLNFSSNNKDGLKKLIEMRLPKNAEGFYSMPLSETLILNLAENKYGFTLTNDGEAAKKIAGGGALGNLPSPIDGLAKTSPGVFYMDMNLDNYPAPVREFMAQSLGEKNYAAFAGYTKMFKNTVATGTQTDSEVSVNLNSGEGNSLYRLFAQADEAYKHLQ